MKKLLFTFVLLFSLNSFGQSNYSLEFDGVDDKLDLGYLNTFNASGNVTIEAWVKPYSLPPSETRYDIFVLGGNGHLGLGYDYNSNFSFELVFQNNNHLTILPNIEYVPNKWYHVAGVYDSSNNIGYLFVNGDLVGSINTPNEDFYTPNSINSNIGSYYQPFYGRHFQGAISSIHLTQDIKYSNNFCPESNLQQTSNTIGLWLMNEGNGTTAYDSVNSFDGALNGPTWITDVPTLPIENIPTYVPMDGLNGWWSFNGNATDQSGNGNDGTIFGAQLTMDRDGNCDRAYLFDGVNDNIQLLNPYFEGNTIVSEFTFSYWINLVTLPQTSLNYGILHFDSYWKEKDHRVRDDGIIYYTGANPNPNAYFGIFSATNTINANQWYNIIITYKNSTLRIYVDGILISTEIIAQSTLDYSIEINGNSNGKNLFGSKTSVNNGDYDFFNGKIDDIGAWQRVLTECEIQDLFNSQLNSIDKTVTQNVSSLKANQDNASYQWYDCNNGNALLSGEVNQEFFPSTTGLYRVEITLNGCMVISECHEFISLNIPNSTNETILIYPNPTVYSFNIDVNFQSYYIIYSINGSIIKKGILDKGKNFIQGLNFSSGIYLVKIMSGDNYEVKKIIIK